MLGFKYTNLELSLYYLDSSWVTTLIIRMHALYNESTVLKKVDYIYKL